ncbi:MAG: TonB-dependent receptor family protein [Bacteroides sp.]|nr:TonB-dependent receptor family protein [Bacteroides sp.]
MKTIRILIPFFWLMHLSLHAQVLHNVSGSVQSTAGESLIGAHVRLIRAGQENQSHVMATDGHGRFLLQVSKGEYALEISYIGHAKYIATVQVVGDVRLPVINLNEDSQLMETVVITARTVTYNPNGYVAEIAKNPLYHNMDLNEILKFTPGTYTTLTGVQLFGRNVSKIYLNGRELRLQGEQLVKYLETLHAKDVKHIEVIAASGVEEDAERQGQSILKITTINPETGGMMAIVGGTTQGEEKSLYTLSSNMNWRINKQWGTYLRVNTGKSDREQGELTETHFHTTDSRRAVKSVMDNEAMNYSALFGLSYDLDANNLFFIEASCGRNGNSRQQTSTTRNLADDHYTDIASGSSDHERTYRKNNLSLGYTRKFASQATLNIKADRLENRVDDDELQFYQYTTAARRDFDRWNDEKNLVYTLRADYSQRFKPLNSRLSLGAKSTWFSNESNTDYLATTDGQRDETGSYQDRYKYTEDIYALYAKYGFTLKAFSMNLGIRMEHAHIAPRSSSNPDRNGRNISTDFFPEVRLNYTLNKEKGHNISLGYNRSLSRPGMQSLNPLIVRLNEYSYSMGNPLLEANYTDRVSLMATLFDKYILEAYWSHRKNGTMGIIENRDGRLYSTYTNGAKENTCYAYLMLPVKVGKWLNVRLSGSCRFSEHSYGADESRNFYWSTGYFASITLPANFRISHDLFYTSSSKGLYSSFQEPLTSNVHINKTFPKLRLSVTLAFVDIFNCQGGYQRDSFRDDFYQTLRGNYNNRSVLLSLSYRLNWGRKSAVRQGSSGNTEESGRFAKE